MLLKSTDGLSKKQTSGGQLIDDAVTQQQQLVDKYGLINSKQLQNKCDDLIQQLMLKEFKSCLLLNADFANAYSLANHNVILTKGLLTHIRNDDQLAHILAHEHAHLVLKHHQLAQELVKNPPKLFTKSRIKKFYRKIEQEADGSADKLLKKLDRDYLQVQHYLKRVQKSYKERSKDHAKLKNRIIKGALPSEQIDSFWQNRKD